MGWWIERQHRLTNQETVIQESRSFSSSQKDQIFCIWTQDTKDVEKSTPNHQWIQTEALSSSNIPPTTRNFINTHHTESRKHYPGSGMDLRLQKTGKWIRIPHSLERTTLWRIHMGGSARGHQRGSLTMPRPRIPQEPSQCPGIRSVCLRSCTMRTWIMWDHI